MAKQLQLRRGTTAQHATFTGAVGEVTIDTDKDVVVVHDGATAGGFPSQKELISGTSIKTINDTSLLGSGNISIGVSSLSDTSISSPLSGQVLSYNGDNWENVTFSALDAYSKEDTDILLAAKQETLVSGTNIKTINSNNILGSGDISMPSLSGVTAYHLLQGNLAVDNYVTTQGFNTTLYTGNGSTQSINTGIDMSTQWGNDASEKFGGLVLMKRRDAVSSWAWTDTVRGASKVIRSDTTATEGTSGTVTSFLSNGITIGTEQNTNLATYTSGNFQTTHRISGTTNHGKAYTCHYNPFTGFTIVKYEGSGIAGHEIPHHLGRKLGMSHIKNLTSAEGWDSQALENIRLYLHLINANAGATFHTYTDEYHILNSNTASYNSSGSSYILYGWANSYFDEANKLIGNYEVGIYQGTGASGNKVTTRGKPAWIMIKQLDTARDWYIFDNQRDMDSLKDHYLIANSSLSESVSGTFGLTFQSDGFTCNDGQAGNNSSGGQYLYMVAYDTNSNGGGSYYPRATDTSNLQIQNAIIPFANGIDANGTKITTLSKNETISGLTLTAGKNYVYCKNDGTYGVKNIAPNYGKTNPANGGDFYDILENKWYTSAGAAITESRNYLDAIVYGDSTGNPLYIEELQKIKYENIVEANEFKSRNSCTAWVNFDGTTTPPTIRDSYNVSNVVKTATGKYDIYFSTSMDNANYTLSGSIADDGYLGAGAVLSFLLQNGMTTSKTTNKVSIYTGMYTGASNNKGGYAFNINDVTIFGGKN